MLHYTHRILTLYAPYTYSISCLTLLFTLISPVLKHSEAGPGVKELLSESGESLFEVILQYTTTGNYLKSNQKERISQKVLHFLLLHIPFPIYAKRGEYQFAHPVDKYLSPFNTFCLITHKRIKMFSPLSHKIVFPDTPLYNHPQSLKSSHSKNKTNNREQPIQRLIIFVPTRTKHVNNMRNKYLLSLLAALGFSGCGNNNEIWDEPCY